MQKKEIKNIKIDAKVHYLLKRYCNQKGLKLHKFLEKLIIDNCKDVKDIYGDI